MLEPAEKAYCLALEALKQKDYRQAAGHFDRAAGFFENNQEFQVLKRTTDLLVELKNELAAAENRDDETLTIEEVFTDGQETELP